MHRRLCALAVVTAAWLLPATVSDAATYCVGSPANCPAGGITPSPPKLDRAVELAGLSVVDDVILLGAGTFSGNDALIVPQNANAGALLIEGQGAATVVGSAQILDAEATVRAVEATGPASGTAITVTRGAADAISVDSTAAGLTGVRLAEGGRLTNSTVTLTGGGSVATLTTSGDGTVADSSLNACTGAVNHSTGTTTVQRTRVLASTGFDADVGGMFIDTATHGFDSTLTCAPNAAVSMRGAATVPRSVRVTNLTAVDDSGVVGTAGIRLRRDSGASTMDAIIGSSIFTGHASTLVRTTATADPAPTATISASAIDEVQATAAGYVAGAEPNLDNPVLGFVDELSGDFRLTYLSELIDVGEAVTPAGSSPTDLAGSARELEGKPAVNGPVGRRDIGAFEYVPGLPTVTGTVIPDTADIGDVMTFVVGTSDPGDPGEDLTYEWAFDDGTTLSGEAVDKSFATAGPHVATLTATDASGWTATDDVPVTVTIPAPPDPEPDPEPEPEPVITTDTGTATGTGGGTTGGTPPTTVRESRGPGVAFTRRAAAVDLQGRVAIRVQCRATSATCVGRVVLTTVRRVNGRPRTIKLGAAAYRIGPETIETVRVKLNRSRLPIVRAASALKVRATATVTGGRATSATLTVRGRR
jgi:hypothetical protein